MGTVGSDLKYIFNRWNVNIILIYALFCHKLSSFSRSDPPCHRIIKLPENAPEICQHFLLATYYIQIQKPAQNGK